MYQIKVKGEGSVLCTKDYGNGIVLDVEIRRDGTYMVDMGSGKDDIPFSEVIETDIMCEKMAELRRSSVSTTQKALVSLGFEPLPF